MSAFPTHPGELVELTSDKLLQYYPSADTKIKDSLFSIEDRRALFP